MPRQVVLGRDLPAEQVIELLKTLGGRIALKRHELNMTQETLASKVNVSQSLVSRWERNLDTPLVHAEHSLAEALQTTRDWLRSTVNKAA